MTNEQFDSKVREVMRLQGLSEEDARLQVSLEAGEGGDVAGSPFDNEDPEDTLKAWDVNEKRK